MTDNSYSELLTATVELNVTDFEAKMRAADKDMQKFEAEGRFTGTRRTFTSVGDSMLSGALQAAMKFAERVMIESLVECPEDTGVLMDSHDVLAPVRVGNRIKITMGYGYGDDVNEKTGRVAAQYALPVHEIYDAYHDPPTKDHFLLDPLVMEAARFGPEVAASMRRTGSLGNRITTLVEDGKLLGTGELGTVTEVPAFSAPGHGYKPGKSIRGKGGRFVAATGSKISSFSDKIKPL